MSKQSENINFKIDADLKSALDDIAYQQDQTASEVIRLSLKIYIFLRQIKKLDSIISLLLDSAINPIKGGRC